MTDLATFNRFVSKVAWPTSITACWNWMRARTNDGYARFAVDGVTRAAHRYAFTTFRGEIPEGLVIDHLCRNRACVNPLHMEAVSKEENDRRGKGPFIPNSAKQACIKGHPFDSANTYRAPNGTRACRKCRDDAVGRYRAKTKRSS